MVCNSQVSYFDAIIAPLFALTSYLKKQQQSSPIQHSWKTNQPSSDKRLELSHPDLLPSCCRYCCVQVGRNEAKRGAGGDPGPGKPSPLSICHFSLYAPLPLLLVIPLALHFDWTVMLKCFGLPGPVSLKWSLRCLSVSHFTNHKLTKKLFINVVHKVNRCRARNSPRATTTNQPTNRAPNESARPGPKWPKLSILGKIVQF